MPHEIAGLTSCLICGRRFAGPQAIVIGTTRAVSLLEKLAQHLETAHPDQSQAIALLSLQYVGLLRMMNFKTTDPALKIEVDKLRWAINQQTIAARISDETIRSKTDELARSIIEATMKELLSEFQSALDEKKPIMDSAERLTGALLLNVQAKLYEVITAMRDVMQEPNKYVVNLVGATGIDQSPAGSNPDSALHRA
jgi:hypothetical protein